MFRIWGMMQVIDFSPFSLLRGCYCIFSRCVSAPRLSIVSRCDQNISVDERVNLQVFEAYLTHSASTGEQLLWRQNTSFSSQGFPSFQPSVPPSNPGSSFLRHKAAQLFMNVSSVLPARSIFPPSPTQPTSVSSSLTAYLLP